jgi:hypothetical protein
MTKGLVKIEGQDQVALGRSKPDLPQGANVLRLKPREHSGSSDLCSPSRIESRGVGAHEKRRYGWWIAHEISESVE